MIGVDDARVRPDLLLPKVREAIMVGALMAVADPVAVGVDVPWRGPGQEFEGVP